MIMASPWNKSSHPVPRPFTMSMLYSMRRWWRLHVAEARRNFSEPAALSKALPIWRDTPERRRPKRRPVNAH